MGGPHLREESPVDFTFDKPYVKLGDIRRSSGNTQPPPPWKHHSSAVGKKLVFTHFPFGFRMCLMISETWILTWKADFAENKSNPTGRVFFKTIGEVSGHIWTSPPTFWDWLISYASYEPILKDIGVNMCLDTSSVEKQAPNGHGKSMHSFNVYLWVLINYAWKEKKVLMQF